MALGILAAPAAAGAAGAMSGTVTDETTEQPLADIRVAVKRGGTGGFVAYARTAADGTWTIEGLDAGYYEVAFLPPAGVNYVREWYDDVPDVTLSEYVEVTDGAMTEYVDAALAPGATISGRVTGKNAAGVAKVCVTAFYLDYDGITRRAGETATDASGTYTIVGLRPDTYKVWFGPWESVYGGCPGGARDSGYSDAWFGGQTDFFTAESVALTAQEQRSGVDARLERTRESTEGGTSGQGTSGETSGTGPTTPQAGACLVPRLRGKTLRDARKALARANCKPGKVIGRPHRSVKRDRVIGSRPKAGASLPAKAKVAIVVSRGRAGRG